MKTSDINFKHIRTSITMVTSLLIFLIFISFGFITYNLNKVLIQGTISTIHHEITNKILVKLDVYMDTPYTTNNLTDAFLRINPEHLGDLNLLRKYLYKQLSIFKTVNLIAFGTENGDYVEAQRLDDGRLRTGSIEYGNLGLWKTNPAGQRILLEKIVHNYDPRIRPWYLNSKNKRIPAWSDIYLYSSNDKPAISANQPYFFESSTLDGVITTSITLNGISKFLSELALGNNSSVLILEPSGLAIATSKGIPLMDELNKRITGSNLENKLLSSISRFFQLSIENNYTNIISEFSIVIEKTKYLVRATPYYGPCGLRWNVLVIIPEADYMSVFYKASTWGILIFIIFMIITLFSSYLIAGQTTKPIVQLSNLVSTITFEKNNISELIIPENILTRNDEIGILAQSFLDMNVKLSLAFINLNTSLKEKNILLKEVHHRVKNNLQIITSLVNLQLSDISDVILQDTLESLQSRIQSMSLVHEMLYSTDSLTQIDFHEYLNQIIATISATFNNIKNPVQVTLTGDILYLDIERTTTCGLLINEIIINAFKHAFFEQDNCRIDITLNKDNFGIISINVRDNGVGISSLNKSDNTQRMGSLLIDALTDQIGGEINIIKNNGTSVNLTFKS